MSESAGLPDPAPEAEAQLNATTPAAHSPLALRVAVVGCGYVGLVSGLGLARLGWRVDCVDADLVRIAALRQGVPPFFEPGLREQLARCAGAAPGDMARTAEVTGTAKTLPLYFYPSGQAPLHEADVVMLAVGTPSAADGHGADLQALHAAAEHAVQHMKRGALLLIKSTVPVGTGDALVRRMQARLAERAIEVAANPEFLRAGQALDDVLAPNRIVLGCETPAAEARLRALYAPLLARGVPCIVTTRRTAELVKYAANAMLASKLALVNELADLCESVDADVSALTRAVGLDPRIGADYLQPGPGQGGSCLPKDLRALARTGQEHGQALPLIEALIHADAQRAWRMLDKARAACGGTLQDKTVAVLGLAFKAGTDDVRASPALTLIEHLRAHGATVRATDPHATNSARQRLPDLHYEDDAYRCAEGADLVVLATAWPVYQHLDLPRLARVMRHPALLDLRNALAPQAVAAAGLHYSGIGRPASTPSPSRP